MLSLFVKSWTIFFNESYIMQMLNQGLLHDNMTPPPTKKIKINKKW